MNPPVAFLSEEVWTWLCSTAVVRPSVVAAGRARLAANDWPAPIEVADALLARCPGLLVGVG